MLRDFRPVVPVRLSSCSASLTPIFEMLARANRPTKSPAPKESASETRTAALSMRTSLARGKCSRPIAVRVRNTPAPRAIPPKPPSSANPKFSRISCRMICTRLAPKAIRVASSLRRRASRASARLAMFSPPIRRTSNAPPHNR